MTFSVNVKALAGLPAALDRRGSDLAEATVYVASNTSISRFGLSRTSTGEHQRLIAHIQGYLDTSRRIYPGDRRRRGSDPSSRHMSRSTCVRRSAPTPRSRTFRPIWS